MSLSPSTSNVSRRRVLIVEDAEFVHHIYRVAFRRLGGWDLIHATNGLEGLKALDPAPVDLIIADVNMPVMNGLEFLGHVRQRPRDQSTHVLIATTEGEDGQIRTAIARGAQSYLKKPFTLEQFLQLIGRVIPTLPQCPPA